MKNKDIYIQDDASSCGARCLQSIVSHYGGFVPLETALEDTNTTKSGTNALELVAALKKYGFQAYGLKTNLECINRDKLPVIAHTLKNGYEHFLVIYSIDESEVLTMDPEIGKIAYKKDEFQKIFKNNIIIIFPEGEIIKYKKSISILKMFIPLLKKNRVKIISIFILSIIILLFSLIINYHLKLLNIIETPFTLTYMILILQIFNSLFQFIKEKVLIIIMKNIDIEIQNTFTSHIFKLPIRYLNNKRVGEIVKKIEDMTTIKEFLLRLTVINSLDLITLLISGVAMLIISKNLTLVYVIVVLLYFVITISTYKKTYRYGKEVYRTYNDYSGSLVEYLDGCESIKNINEEDLYIQKIDHKFKNFSETAFRKNNRDIKIRLERNFVLEIGIILSNLIGFLSLGTEFTLYDLIVFTSIFSLFFNSIESILETFTQFLKGRAIFRNICEFIDVEEEKDFPTYNGDFKSMKIDDLSYSYDHYRKTIKNVSLKIVRGEKILLKGPSGIGKSTLAKAISGKLKDYGGKIYLNDKDITSISVKSLRNYCVYIGQEEKLFTTTIFDNVVQINPDKDRFEKVSKIVKMDDLIDKRREKENTNLLEGASNLSGGERARIILGRALYKNPPILIIDETLSSVSEQMEDEILDNLLKMPELTLIYITHRNKEAKFKKIIEFRKDGNYEIKRK